jgi:uncharacterized protein (DUF342 family)
LENRDGESPNECQEYIVISISEDAMKATADFLPFPEHITLSKEDIEDILHASGITHGLLMDNLNYAALRCKRDKTIVPEVPAAIGLPPVAEIAAYYTLLPEYAEARKPCKEGEDQNVKVDYREYSPYTIVDEGALLATYTPKVPGILGSNVYGIDIPFEITSLSNICAGKNTRADETGIHSTICGQLLVVDGRIDVEENLVIKGSVDYSTGHIDFPGDVTVHGDVKDCFKLHSGGTIDCKQTLDASDVFARGNLIVAGGIIGRNPLELQAHAATALPAGHAIEDRRGTIRVDGSIKTGHITHCQIYCRGDLEVDKLIFDSQIYTLGAVRMSDGATIENAEIHALHGVSTGTVENRTGKVSVFHLGIDWTQLELVAENAAKIAGITKNIEKIQRFRFSPQYNTNAWDKATPLLLALEKEKAQLVSQRDELHEKLYADNDAALSIAGDLAAGTIVEIGPQSLTAPLKFSATALRLNAERTQILTGDYESPQQSAQRLKFLRVRRKQTS